MKTMESMRLEYELIEERFNKLPRDEQRKALKRARITFKGYDKISLEDKKVALNYRSNEKNV